MLICTFWQLSNTDLKYAINLECLEKKWTKNQKASTKFLVLAPICQHFFFALSRSHLPSKKLSWDFNFLYVVKIPSSRRCINCCQISQDFLWFSRTTDLDINMWLEYAFFVKFCKNQKICKHFDFTKK